MLQLDQREPVVAATSDYRKGIQVLTAFLKGGPGCWLFGFGELFPLVGSRTSDGCAFGGCPGEGCWCGELRLAGGLSPRGEGLN